MGLPVVSLPQARAAGEIGEASKVFAGANVAQGEMHYNELKCAACHAQRMMGSSTAMFTRPDRKVRSAAELLGFTQMCASRLNHSLFPDEVRDIAAYLNEAARTVWSTGSQFTTCVRRSAIPLSSILRNSHWFHL